MTPKQKKFIKAYLGEAQFCAAKAARMAGYADATHEGWRLKNNPEILSAINEALDGAGMSEQRKRVRQKLDAEGRRTRGRIL